MKRLDDLQCNGLKVWQDTDSYCFSSDSVVLANTVKAPAGAVVADFGTGCGVIALLVAAKNDVSKIYAIEKQRGLYDLTCENVAFNRMEDRIEPMLADIADAPRLIGREKLDVVVCNPPYFRAGSGDTRGGESRAARHESGCDLFGIVSSAAKTLKFGGSLFMVHRTERLAEVICAATECGMQAKELTLVRAKADKEPETFVIRCRKGAAPGLKIKTLTMYGGDGNMTEQAAALYGR